MKTVKQITVVALAILVITVAFAKYAHGAEQTQHQFDKKAFTKIAKKVIGAILTGNVNADKMLLDVEKLTDMGVEGCKEHMGEAETPEAEKKIMQITIEAGKNTNVVEKDGKMVAKDGKYVRKMTKLTLKKIEELWHEGGALKEKGIDLEKFDHFAEVMCHYDGVVHPATCVICLKEYKKTGDESKKEELLEQIKAELKEVVEHMKHLE